MSSAATSHSKSESAPDSVNSGVWERVWRHELSAERDDGLLSRERQSPRWNEIRTRAVNHFGSLSGIRVVELGCGRGDCSVLFAELGAQVTLVDTCSAALDQARRRFQRLSLPAQFVLANMFDPEFQQGGQFDLAVSSGVIEHFVGTVRTESIAAHAQAIRLGGMIVVSVPAAASPAYRLWKCWWELRGWWPYGVERPYARRELIRRAKAVGLFGVDVISLGFWQSVGDHLFRDIMGIRGVDWSASTSVLDRWMGATHVLFAENRLGTSPNSRVGSCAS